MVLTGPVIRRRLAVCMAVFFMLFSGLSARLALAAACLRMPKA